MKAMVYATLDEEIKLWTAGYQLVCGVDEVGRGCFAGPVVTAAVMFPANVTLPFQVADSKLLNAKKREELVDKIKEMALCFAITETPVELINKVGIGKATQISFFNSVKSLLKAPDFILIDAFFINGIDRAIQNAIKNGDRLSASIAAASIIAKVYRDKLMESLDPDFPEYEFRKHKGYGTKFHQEAIRKHGLTKIHRKSFNLEKFMLGANVS
jgi:ribonuclease HII